MADKRFTGTDRYVATEDLTTAVNAAVTLGRPILIKGEPGTGKTQLAEEIARGLDRPLLEWHVKSTTKAQQGLYEYDAVARLRDSQTACSRTSASGSRSACNRSDSTISVGALRIESMTLHRASAFPVSNSSMSAARLSPRSGRSRDWIAPTAAIRTISSSSFRSG